MRATKRHIFFGEETLLYINKFMVCSTLGFKNDATAD